jgi:VWFA-related protein
MGVGCMKHKLDAAKNLILRAAILFVLAAPGIAQAQSVPVFPQSMDHTFHEESPIDKTPLVFSSHAEYVLVPVIVRDKNRQYVKGLSKADFTIQEDGRVQKITSVEEIKTETSPLRRVSAAQNEFTNTPSDANPRRLTIIVLDLINTRFQDQAQARKSIINLLSRSVDEGSLIQLLTISPKGITVVHDYTEDPKALIVALRTLSGNFGSDELAKSSATADQVKKLSKATAGSPTIGGRILDFATGADAQYSALQRDIAISTTLTAFQRVAQSVANISGRKSLVWVTGAFPFTIDDANSEIMGSASFGAFERTMQLLNSANVSMYPVDARGLVALNISAESSDLTLRNIGAVEHDYSQGSKEHLATLQTMTTVAEMTGGKAFINRNDVDNSVSEAMQDGTAYYLLSYPLNKTNTKAGWRKLQLKCKGDGYKIQARRGFFVTRATVNLAESKQSELSNALDSPLEFTALPIKARWLGTPFQSKGGKIFSFELELPANSVSPEENENRLSLDFRIMATNTQGATSGNVAQTFEGTLPPASAEQLKKEGVKYKSSFELVPGEYTIHFVVRDNVSGKVGSLVTHLSVV